MADRKKIDALLERIDRTVEAQGPDSLWVDSAQAIRDLLADNDYFREMPTLAVYVKAQEDAKKLEKIRAYAEDRDFHAKGHLNTVNSGRIASDLFTILNAPGPYDEQDPA